LCLLIALVLGSAGCGRSSDEAASGGGSGTFRHVTPSTDSARPNAVIAEEAKKAEQLNLKPFVFFSASWCPPCQAVKGSMDDPLMQDAFSGTYIIELDIEQWPQLADAFRVGPIPVFHEVDSAGNPTGRSIDGNAWGENIPANMAPPLKQFFQAP
jgi:thiol-disulfide isomerase/thioredoxin